MGYTFLIEQRTQTSAGILGSANGLSEFIYMWGIAGIIFLYKGIKGFFLQLQKTYPFKGILIPAFVFVLYISSNPVTRTPLFFALMLLPLLKIGIKKRHKVQTVIPQIIPVQKSN